MRLSGAGWLAAALLASACAGRQLPRSLDADDADTHCGGVVHDEDEVAPRPTWSVPAVVLVRDGAGELVVWQRVSGDMPLVPPAQGAWLLAPAAPLARDHEIAAFLANARDPALTEVPVHALAFPDQVVTAALARLLGELADLTELALPRATIDLEVAQQLAGPLALEALDLSHASLAPGAAAHLIAACPRLRALTVTDVPLDAPAIAAIAALPELVALGASGTGLRDVDAAKLVERVALEVVALARTKAGRLTARALAGTAVRELHLDDTPLGDADAATLAVRAPALTHLTLSRTRVGDKGLAWLPTATSLRQLELADTNVSDRLVRSLNLPALAEVDLGGRPIEARTWIGLAAAATALRVVVAGPNRRVDDAVVAALATHAELRVLGLGETSVTSAGLPALAATPALIELDLHGTAVHDVTALGTLAKLEVLSLRRTEISDLHLPPIASWPALHTLDVGGTALSERALIAIASAPRLARLYADQTEVTAAAIAALAAAPDLRVLHVDGAWIGAPELAPLASRDLRELSLASTAVGDTLAPLLASWPNLELLSVAGTGVTDGLLPAIATQRRLHTLDLSATYAQRVEPLATLPSLRTLGLARTKVDDAGLRALAAAPVEVVSLANTGLGPSALPILEGWPALREVDLTGVALGRSKDAARLLAPLDARGVVITR